MYWLLRSVPTNDDDVQIFKQPETINRLGLNFGRGIIQPTENIPEIIINIEDEQKGSLTDNLLAFGVGGPVFNDKIRGLLEQLSIDNIDYYNTKVFKPNGDALENYKAANIIGIVQCVDFISSELEFWENSNDIQFIDRLVLDEKKLAQNELLIFRIAEFPQLILVDEKIKELFETNNISGVEFIDPEEFIL